MLGSLRPRVDPLHGEMDGDETLESQEGKLINFISSIMFITEPHLPVWDSKIIFLVILQELHFHK